MPGPSLHGQQLINLTGEGVLAESTPWDGPSSNVDSGEGPAQFYALPTWAHTNNPGRVKFIRSLCEDYSLDPRMRWFTSQLLERTGIKTRDYPAMAKAILRFVQTNVYYTQEAGEQLQSPWRTMQTRSGDCDDMAILLCSMAGSVGLPWRLALGGAANGMPARWVEGEPFKKAQYTHIYPILGWPPGKPHMWVAAEPTMKVPLGFDVTVHGIDFDHHGRPTPRPVVLNHEGIAVVGPGSASQGSSGSNSNMAFSGPTLQPSSASGVSWGKVGLALAVGVAVGMKYRGS